MNTDKLSTGGASPSAKSKKREVEKRKSPCTPLREKGKGKEDRRGSLQNRLSRTRMRKRLREALDADLDIGVCRFGDCQGVHRYIPFNVARRRPLQRASDRDGERFGPGAVSGGHPPSLKLRRDKGGFRLR